MSIPTWYLHMHDGEPVYYTDVCEVCERETTGEVPVSRTEMPLQEMPEPGSGRQIPEFHDDVYREENIRKYHRDPWITWYTVSHIFRVLTWAGITAGTWLLVFIMISLITRGTVKW